MSQAWGAYSLPMQSRQVATRNVRVRVMLGVIIEVDVVQKNTVEPTRLMRNEHSVRRPAHRRLRAPRFLEAD